MKTKRFLIFGLPVLLLALGLVLAGCDGLNNETSNTTDNEEDDSDSIELNLPPLEAETTGQKTIEETVTSEDVVLASSNPEGLKMPDEFAEMIDARGVTITITDGDLTFTLPETPTSDAIGYGPAAWNDKDSPPFRVAAELFGESPTWNLYVEPVTFEGIEVTIKDGTGTPIDEKEATIEFALIDRVSWNIKNTYYWLDRKTEKSSSGNSNSSKIVYVYVSENVTLSRDAKVVNSNYTYQSDVNWGAVDLALEEGWNLVQIDTSTTYNMSDKTSTKDVTVKIAEENVPWTLAGYVSPPNKRVVLTNIPVSSLEKGESQNNPILGVLVMGGTPQAGTAPTGVVAFTNRSISGSGTVSAGFDLYGFSEWPPEYSSQTSHWTGTGEYYVALIPNFSNSTNDYKLDKGKVYAGESVAVKVTFDDDELEWDNSSSTMVLTLSYTDFIDHDFGK
ncbi:MAG: hypothetical protein LBK61_12170 [Spirochaetaceae bacterium]|jgi:hypothetical protein|nr:hypothetical protein [Spirochaetaceae bacterium]